MLNICINTSGEKYLSVKDRIIMDVWSPCDECVKLAAPFLSQLDRIHRSRLPEAYTKFLRPTEIERQAAFVLGIVIHISDESSVIISTN